MTALVPLLDLRAVDCEMRDNDTPFQYPMLLLLLD